MVSISNSKRGIAVFLLVLTSIRILIIPVVYLDFEMNKEYIIQNLCENRFKPELNCDGHCYLANKLNKVAEDNARNEADKQGQNFKKILQETFHYETFDFTQTFTTTYTIPTVFTYNSGYDLAFSTSVFHPPSV